MGSCHTMFRVSHHIMMHTIHVCRWSRKLSDLVATLVDHFGQDSVSQPLDKQPIVWLVSTCTLWQYIIS